MKRGLSLYLDVIRFMAAIGVFLGHSRALMAPAIPKVLAVHASECVIVFFVLSGFVIRFVSRTREQSWQAYAAARAVRLYSVAIPAIVLTLILDHFGASIAPAHYARLEVFDGPAHWGEVLASLAFLNEAWRAHIVLGSNEAYWSLGFEAAYYVAFGAVFIRKVAVRTAFLLVWLAIFGPWVAAYGLLWLLGAGLYDVVSNPAAISRLPKWLALVCIASPVVYPLLKYVVFPPVGSAFRAYDLQLTVIAWLYAAILALVFALHLAGAARLLDRADWIGDRPAAAIRWLAGATFTIYLMHQPLIVFLAAVGKTEHSAVSLQAAAVVLALAVLFVMAELGERRKAHITACMRLASR